MRLFVWIIILLNAIDPQASMKVLVWALLQSWAAVWPYASRNDTAAP